MRYLLISAVFLTLFTGCSQKEPPKVKKEKKEISYSKTIKAHFEGDKDILSGELVLTKEYKSLIIYDKNNSSLCAGELKNGKLKSSILFSGSFNLTCTNENKVEGTWLSAGRWTDSSNMNVLVGSGTDSFDKKFIFISENNATNSEAIKKAVQSIYFSNKSLSPKKW